MNLIVDQMETKWSLFFIVSLLISLVSIILFIFFDFPFLLLFLFLPLVYGIKGSTNSRGTYSRIFCKKCGAKLPLDSIYCPNCGGSID
ncbi:MAG: zinc ribbon domain-containing protein [Promethearchaeota archaeon]